MKLFGRSGGYYLFWTGFVYFWVGMYFAFTHYALPEIATALWILVLSLPFILPPFGRWLNMSIEWDKKMFNWLRNYRKPEGSIAEDMNKVMNDMNNVVNLPGPKLVPPVEPPAVPEKPAKIFYRIGVTDNNRVAFSMGMSEITMTKLGCQQMIEQIEVFMNQLQDEQCQDEE
jgi:hypothetical protein